MNLLFFKIERWVSILSPLNEAINLSTVVRFAWFVSEIDCLRYALLTDKVFLYPKSMSVRFLFSVDGKFRFYQKP